MTQGVLKLTVTTPLSRVVEADDVVHVRAEDETGAFGILAGHADFLTALTISVVTWRDRRGVERHVAVRGGVLQVRGGEVVAIAAPEALAGDTLRRLQTEVLVAFRRAQAEEEAAHRDAQRLYVAAIRQLCRFVRSERAPAVPGGPGVAPVEGEET